MGGMQSSTASSASDCGSSESYCADDGTCIDCLGILTENGCGCKLSTVGIIVIIILVLCCLCSIAGFVFYRCRKRD